MYAAGERAFTIADGTIIGNKAIDKGYNKEGKGGGVYVDADGYLDMWGKFTMEGGTIEGNTASRGGGVYVEAGRFIMNAGTITNNRATQSGGGKAMMVTGFFRWNGGEIKDNYGTGRAIETVSATIEPYYTIINSAT